MNPQEESQLYSEPAIDSSAGSEFDANSAAQSEGYIGSVLFFKHVIFAVTLLLIIVPTIFSIYFGVQVHSLRKQLALENPVASTDENPGESSEGGEAASDGESSDSAAETAEVPDYTKLYPELYADDSKRGTEQTENCVYLTFDDGPSSRTDEILDILKSYGVKATFFVIAADDEEDIARMKRIVDEGHTLAVHTFSHDYNMIYSSVEAYLDDFNNMYNQIYEVTGVKPQIFRFPGGSINGYNGAIYEQLIAEMTRRGFVYFDWNVGSGDAASSSLASSATISSNSLSGMGKSRPIILMHDSNVKTTTVEALPSIIMGYANAGYKFAGLSEAVPAVTFGYKK